MKINIPSDATPEERTRLEEQAKKIDVFFLKMNTGAASFQERSTFDEIMTVKIANEDLWEGREMARVKLLHGALQMAETRGRANIIEALLKYIEMAKVVDPAIAAFLLAAGADIDDRNRRTQEVIRPIREAALERYDAKQKESKK